MENHCVSLSLSPRFYFLFFLILTGSLAWIVGMEGRLMDPIVFYWVKLGRIRFGR